MAMATSACRDAVNTPLFFDRCEPILGVRPELITGTTEAVLAYRGATLGQEYADPVVVSDIGGGSTEFVTDNDEVSIDIGSVRLTETVLANRPASFEEMNDARGRVEEMFVDVNMGEVGTPVGVAGTWTSLGAIAQELEEYDSTLVHGYRLSRRRLEELTLMLSLMSAEETALIPGIDPNRAPVILAGAVVAGGVMDVLGADGVVVSERDSLHGAAMELLALP
jgi:exopolyphosphatase/guanosine-5'-triphosphate,3'-diphosphate pyrophosphatase